MKLPRRTRSKMLKFYLFLAGLGVLFFVFESQETDPNYLLSLILVSTGVFGFRKIKQAYECEWCQGPVTEKQAFCPQCGGDLNPVFDVVAGADLEFTSKEITVSDRSRPVPLSIDAASLNSFQNKTALPQGSESLPIRPVSEPPIQPSYAPTQGGAKTQIVAETQAGAKTQIVAKTQTGAKTQIVAKTQTGAKTTTVAQTQVSVKTPTFPLDQDILSLDGIPAQYRISLNPLPVDSPESSDAPVALNPLSVAPEPIEESVANPSRPSLPTQAILSHRSVIDKKSATRHPLTRTIGGVEATIPPALRSRLEKVPVSVWRGLAAGLLLVTGISLFSRTNDKAESAVAQYARRGDLPQVQEAIKSLKLNDPHQESQKALFAAILAGQTSIVEYLLKEGIQPLPVKYKLGTKSPLSAAIELGYTDMVELLLEYGALMHIKDPGSFLALAASLGQVEAVDLLIAHQVNLNQRNSTNGKTPLIYAAEKGYATVVAHLLKKGADTRIQDILGRNALDVADLHHHAKVSSLLQGLSRPDRKLAGQILLPISGTGVGQNQNSGPEGVADPDSE
jgi:hypothetical protein